jgi:hypothetical protein
MESAEPGKNAIGATCAECRTPIVVMPPNVYEAVGSIWGPEGELAFTEKVAGDSAQTGSRLAVADAHGWYACPVCGHRAQVPADVRGLFGDAGYSVEE